MSDGDGYTFYTQYDYDEGMVTARRDPKGAVDLLEYDSAGRLVRVTDQNTGAYRRWVYPAAGHYVVSYRTARSVGEEVMSAVFYDGAGRVRAVETEFVGSRGGYRGVHYMNDVMGRRVWESNPTEINDRWEPVGDDAGGWQWTRQEYDWQGRPTLRTNSDGSTREQQYSGCGCAGGEVVTERDERGRRKRLYHDVLGRLVRVEELNWDQSVYSTVWYSYNARDQLVQINHQGQIRTFEYDGHGRLWRKVTPEQGVTTYAYNADDTVRSVTDGRGARQTYQYNGRHQVSGIEYEAAGGAVATAGVSFGYGETGNRVWMEDGLGRVSYEWDVRGRLSAETRWFRELNGSYRLEYSYEVGGALSGVRNPWGAEISYERDRSGQVVKVRARNYGSVSEYVRGVEYRAWGGIKRVSYGNGRQLEVRYDNRQRVVRWDVSGVLGWEYAYNYQGWPIYENSGRVVYARNLYDGTLDRSYEYDQVGRLIVSHSGTEARSHVSGINYGVVDGPYAHHYQYDVWGNVVRRVGWGGWNASYEASYEGNRRSGFEYDGAGNLVSDGLQRMSYDVTGQQVLAVAGGYRLEQWYDGDRLRVKKRDGGEEVYYVRSSVLGGQVVAEIRNGGGVWSWSRGWVYWPGGALLAIEAGGVKWVHQDPVAKSQRLTDESGAVVAVIELDPWGGETARSEREWEQVRRYTTYERDGNGVDQAQMRSYRGWWSRFDQPDPWDGS